MKIPEVGILERQILLNRTRACVFDRLVTGLSPGVQYTCGVSLANVSDTESTRILVNTTGE